MRSTRSRLYLGLAAIGFASALTLLGCKGSTDVELCKNAGAEVVVNGEVVFKWGDCHQTLLAVYDHFGQLAWGIEGTFKSPVTYGETPRGASSLGEATELQAGGVT